MRITSWICTRSMTSVLQARSDCVDLLGGGLLRAAVDLRHQEDLLPVAVAQRLAHAHLALAVVVVPAVVQERDAVVDRACG